MIEAIKEISKSPNLVTVECKQGSGMSIMYALTLCLDAVV